MQTTPYVTHVRHIVKNFLIHSKISVGSLCHKFVNIIFLSEVPLYNICLSVVHIQLDEPLWTPRSGPKVVAMDIMGLCVQLDTVIMTSGLSVC